MWGPGGTSQLDSLELPDAYCNRIAVLRDLIEIYDPEIVFLDRDIHRILCDDPGYNAVQAIYGVGPVFAAIFVAEIGDVSRFDSPKALCSWAGLTPKTRGVRHPRPPGQHHQPRVTPGARSRESD